MIGCAVLLGVFVGQSMFDKPEYFFDKPIRNRKLPSDAKNKPVFLTSTGPSFGDLPQMDYPRHWKAAVSIKAFIPWKQEFSIVYSRVTTPIGGYPSRFTFPRSSTWPIFSLGSLRRMKRMDSDGNSILNRILMAHVVLDESALNQTVAVLKRRKMVPMKPNRFGQTPLMLAVESGYPSLVDEILKLNPNLMARDKEGHDIIDYLANSPTRADERYIASRTIWTRETICQSLLDYAAPRELSLIKPRAVALLKTIRVSNEQGIFP